MPEKNVRMPEMEVSAPEEPTVLADSSENEELIAEYENLNKLYRKMRKDLIRYKAGKLRLDPEDAELRYEQKEHMMRYLNVLEVRMTVLDIDIPF